MPRIDSSCPAVGSMRRRLISLPMPLHSRPGQRRCTGAGRSPAASQGRRSDGFLLPLAALMSLLLLLGSLSVQAVSLQGRRRGAAERELQTAEDRLISAAQLLVARIQLRHACLLPLPLEQWAGASCASAGELEQLRRGTVLGFSWQLLRWQPEMTSPAAVSSQPQRLRLELALPAQQRQSALRAGFALQWLGPPWRAMELRPLGLQGEAP
jgi:hypothetical protein